MTPFDSYRTLEKQHQSRARYWSMLQVMDPRDQSQSKQILQVWTPLDTRVMKVAPVGDTTAAAIYDVLQLVMGDDDGFTYSVQMETDHALEMVEQVLDCLSASGNERAQEMVAALRDERPRPDFRRPPNSTRPARAA